ncbi:hemerythrin family protein [candidate division KSB1 bacterium]|nr:hemerythrin family protein [candidate division KSB1 bacterium]
MESITWNDRFSVNVSVIDNQHKKLIALMNELFHAMRLGKGSDAIGSVVDGLLDYATEHFEFEEKYFKEFSFPEAAEHIAQHQSFIKRSATFCRKLRSGDARLSIEVMNFMTNWLIEHIMKCDKKYSYFFNEHGLK